MIKNNQTPLFVSMADCYETKNKFVETNFSSLLSVLFYQAKKFLKKSKFFSTAFKQPNYFDDGPPLINTLQTITPLFLTQKNFNLVKDC